MKARRIPSGKIVDVYFVKKEFYEGRWHFLYREFGDKHNLLIEGDRLVFENVEKCPAVSL